MRVPTPSTMDAATVLSGVKGALAPLGGCAALDPACARCALATIDGVGRPPNPAEDEADGQGGTLALGDYSLPAAPIVSSRKRWLLVRERCCAPATC